MDFAAPIMVDGRMVGSFIGGQVLTGPPDLDRFRDYVKKASEALYSLADVLSTMAYRGMQSYLANIEIERVARMKSDFLANV